MGLPAKAFIAKAKSKEHVFARRSVNGLICLFLLPAGEPDPTRIVDEVAGLGRCNSMGCGGRLEISQLDAYKIKMRHRNMNSDTFRDGYARPIRSPSSG
jgi:hypothetical protein